MKPTTLLEAEKKYLDAAFSKVGRTWYSRSYMYEFVIWFTVCNN